MKALLLVILSSCSSYQYLTVTSDQTIKNEQKELIFENDTLKISFNFNGAWGSLGITLANKTNEAIAVNWQKSSIIYGNAPYSLFERRVKVEGEIQRNQLYERREPNEIPELPIATMKASFNAPKEIDFLPPHTTVGWQKINTSRLVPALNSLPLNLQIQKINSNGFDVKYSEQVFDPASTPFKFRMFITYNIGASGKEFYTQHDLYVTEVKQTTESGPHLVLVNSDGDKFYCRLQ